MPAEKDGMLEAPVWGELPIPSHLRGFIKKPFRYRAILEQMRQHVGVWAVIATFEKGPPKVTAGKAKTEAAQIGNWLRKWRPREAWEIKIRTDHESYSRRNIWARYHGLITHEEDEILRTARHQAFEKRSPAEKAAAREVVAAILKRADPEAENPYLY